MTSMAVRLRAAVALTLILVLLAPPAHAQGKSKPLTWSEAMSLKSGSTIRVMGADSPPVKVQLWYVDDTMLVTSTPKPPKLPGRVKAVLAEMEAEWTVVAKGGEFQKDSVRIAQDGVFDGTKRLADLAQVVKFTPRDEVTALEEAPHSDSRRSLLIAGVVLVALVIVGAFLGKYFSH